MSSTRREFFEGTLGLAGLLALPKLSRHAFARPPLAWPSITPRGRAAKPLRILFLGGTGFIGPHMVKYAMYRGHTVSMFNRGKTAPGLFPGVETLIGDRDNGLDSLKGHQWDVVIDNSGYVPRHVRDSAELLKSSVGRYIFTSTGSVYKFDQDSIDEDSPLLPLEDPKSEDVNKYYGPLKVLCEEAVRKTYGDRGTIVRLHIVAGPGDPTDRFTYWPVRIDQGGEVLAPGDMNNPVEFIDSRDLAEFVVHLAEENTPGTFNAAGPTLDEFGMAQFVYGIRAITPAVVSFTWVDDAFVQEQKGRFPLWISQHGPARGIIRVRSHRAVAAGLKFRPLAVTALDTLEWFKAEPEERRKKFPLNLEAESKILQAWKAKKGATK
jgi:nucleoside-diphosphate-sugar epimerase